MGGGPGVKEDKSNRDWGKPLELAGGSEWVQSRVLGALGFAVQPLIPGPASQKSPGENREGALERGQVVWAPDPGLVLQ